MGWIYVAQDKERWWGFCGERDEPAGTVGPREILHLLEHC